MTDEYTVIELPTEQALEFWPGCAPYVQRGLEHDPYCRVHTTDIHKQIQEGWARVVVIHDDQELRGVAVAQLYRQPSDDQVVLHVASLAGEKMEHWLEQLLQLLEAMATQARCNAITMVGRKGWQRTLRPHGYDLDAISMRKTLDVVREESAA